MKKHFLILCALSCFISCKKPLETKPVTRGLIAKNAMVVSAREEASKIGQYNQVFSIENIKVDWNYCFSKRFLELERKLF